MVKKTIRDIDISGKRFLIRVDFNVPLCENGSVASDRRVRAALPTIRYCLEHNASLVLMTHLGRPAGQCEDQLGLGSVAYRLQKLLSETPVELARSDWNQKVDKLKPGQVLLLENLRFDSGEKRGDKQFAGRLRELGEVYVNESFATCHRKHTSMFAVPKLFPAGTRVIGLLVEKELTALDNLLQSPQQPMVAILGGVKVADKIGVVEALLERVQKLLIGGAMAFTFMKARGLNVGASRVEEDELDLAGRLLDLGRFEAEPFHKGTEAVIRAMAESDALTVVGGGESGEAVEQFELVERIDHVSTGGGAFLEYQQTGSLPALWVMDEQ